MSCHLPVTSVLRRKNASFSNPETGLGSIPGFGATQRLPRLVGTGYAKEIIFSGVRLNAAEAHRIGLVNRVVPLAELIPTCEDLARKIMKASRAAISYAKMVIDQGMQMDIDAGLELEWTITGLCHETAEQKEYMQAFLDRSSKK